MMPSHNAIVRSPKPHPRGPTAHSPARRTPVTTRSESSTTRSARAGGQHRRRQPECPGRVHRRLPDGQQQGLLLGQVAVGDGEPEHRSMVAVLPAMVCVPASRATPSTTSTASGPIR